MFTHTLGISNLLINNKMVINGERFFRELPQSNDKHGNNQIHYKKRMIPQIFENIAAQSSSANDISAGGPPGDIIIQYINLRYLLYK